MPHEEAGPRENRTNSNGYVVRLVPQNAYDRLCILGNDGSGDLIRECMYGRRSVTLRLAYLLGAVAESG